MQPLRDAREAMDLVHRQLLEIARAEFESAHGPIGGPNAYLELLMKHEFFAWMRPMSRLMAEIDEALEGELDPARAAVLKARIEALLREPRYLEYLQKSSDLVLEHAALKLALSRV